MTIPTQHVMDKLIPYPIFRLNHEERIALRCVHSILGNFNRPYICNILEYLSNIGAIRLSTSYWLKKKIRHKLRYHKTLELYIDPTGRELNLISMHQRRKEWLEQLLSSSEPLSS